MAFDGITVAALTKELKETICDGRIAKIAQPESDELLLTIKTKEGQRRLSISASASLPLIYLTNDNKPSPMTAPNFCMLLRKHIGNGRIVDVSQPGLERIIQLRIEHLDELGDLRQKTLVVEIMGKHSNIIFCDEKDQIIDSIKHVPAQMSSVREVLPEGLTSSRIRWKSRILLLLLAKTSPGHFGESPCGSPRQSTPVLPASVRWLPKKSVTLQALIPR